MAEAKDCPKCGLINPPTAQRCDCGWDFVTRSQQGSYIEPKKRSPVAGRIGVAVVVILIIILMRVLFAVLRAGAK